MPQTLPRTVLLLCFLTISAKAGQPNILWVITDDHRADSLSCYSRATTGKAESELGYVMSPHIDRLAQEGVLFTSAFCNSPMCTPSRGSMHTGRYPFRTGHYRFVSTHQEPAFVRPTVSQTLRDHGYGTAVFGKTGWGITKHLDRQKNRPTDFFDFTIEFKSDLARNGFGDIFHSGGQYEFIDGIISPVRTEETIQYPDGTKKRYITQLRDAPIPEEDRRINREVDEQFEILRAYTRLNKSLILGGVNPHPAGKTVDGHIVTEFENYLANADRKYRTLWGKEVQGASGSKPLFANLSFHLPHTPVLPPKEYRDVFKTKSYRIPEFSTDELSGFPPQLVTSWALTCARDKADLALYDLRKDPLEKNNVANSLAYRGLADWFRSKLGTIVLGDGRVECDWSKPNSYSISTFAGGADDKRLDMPPELIPGI